MKDKEFNAKLIAYLLGKEELFDEVVDEFAKKIKKEKNMEYNELIDKIKYALKITRELELYEKMDLQTILKEAWLNGYNAGFDEAEENAKRNFDY